MFDMFKVITKNFFSKPVTRLYPINSERKPFERSRGRIVFNPDNCMLCSLCAKKCPADAITVDRSAGKWELNSFRCIICGECVNSCPKKCITMSNERRHSTAEIPIETFHKEIPKPAPRPAVKPAATAQDVAKAPVQTQSEAKTSVQVQHAVKLAANVQTAAETTVKTPKENIVYKESAFTKQ